MAAVDEPDRDSLSDLSLVEEDTVGGQPDKMEEDEEPEIAPPLSPPPNFRGFTPMEVETTKAKKRTLVTENDLIWEIDHDWLGTVPCKHVSSTPKIKKVGKPEESKPHIPVFPVSPKLTLKPLKKSLPPPMARGSRGWKPSAQYFKPLNAGWKREVIYGRDSDGKYTDKPSTIVYHAPLQPGCKARKFRSMTDLGAFLSAVTHSTLTLHNFSFRNEPMNAPQEQEIVHAEDEKVTIFTEPPPSTPTSGKFSHAPQQDSDEKSTKNPLLTPGKLKVKMFSKMKEKNTINSQKSKFDSQEENTFANPASGGGRHSHLPSMVMPTQSSPGTKAHKKPKIATRSVLRPNDMSPGVNCSIHCEGASGPPVLSCSACHKMYHPFCVGLMEGPDYSGYDFYCADCTPPIGREVVEMPPPLTAAKKSPDSLKLGGSPFLSHLPTMTQRIAPSPPVSRGFQQTTPQNKTKKTKKQPLRPIESQAVINVAGTKYLVVPHPTISSDTKKVKKVPNLLPMLLKPFEALSAEGNRLPSFEIEEASDGKLILVPHGNTHVLPVKKRQEKTSKHSPSDFASNYNALLNVFQYLTPKELMVAGKVNKFWREVSQHSSLWTNVRLLNCKVTDWSGLARQLSRTQAASLDFKKMIHVDNTDETWSNIVKVAPAFHTLKRIELPKVSVKVLREIVDQIMSSPISNLIGINAGSIVTSKEQELDLVAYTSIPHLQELKLKASSGHLMVKHFDLGLQSLLENSASTMKNLSLISFHGLTANHLTLIAKMSNLQSLELGDFNLVQNTLFSKLIPLKHLVHLRLEKGTIGHEVGTLEHFDSLQSLELVDVELRQGFGEGFVKLRKLSELLLIPSYRDEVAAINSEIVDSALSMAGLSVFYLGLTNEWLQSMSALVSSSSSTKPARENFPILVNGDCELFSLQKLFKTLSAALPSAQVKILKMPQTATTKQSINR